MKTGTPRTLPDLKGRVKNLAQFLRDCDAIKVGAADCLDDGALVFLQIGLNSAFLRVVKRRHEIAQAKKEGK